VECTFKSNVPHTTDTITDIQHPLQMYYWGRQQKNTISIDNTTNIRIKIWQPTSQSTNFTSIYKLNSQGDKEYYKHCNLPFIYLVRPRQPIINQQGPGLSGLIHEEAHPVAPYLL